MIKPGQAPKAQWIKFAVAALTYILFIVWVGNYWWLPLLVFIFDLYITKIIPWSFWKSTKETHPTLYSICSWIDAILFALVAVYFINLYIFQNYRIPSSSLEKSLLVGDFLMVSKVSYGPRTPMTPLSFPLAQHTMPLSGNKSYIETPQWEYKRLAGLDTIKAMDIVVFNYPADTIDINGEIVHRPVDRRENYVKRCVGLPGDSLQIIDTHVYINGKPQEEPSGLQLCYYVYTDGRAIADRQFDNIGISIDDRHIGYDNGERFYYLPMTLEMAKAMEELPNVTKVIRDTYKSQAYPFTNNWDRDNYGPVFIPRRGSSVELTQSNIDLYRQAICDYEGNRLEVKDGIAYINGEATTHYTFRMNYYWMMGDNRHNSADSRYWGFVPEDHIVGKPIFIWLSIDKDKRGFDAIRWSRLFTFVENIK